MCWEKLVSLKTQLLTCVALINQLKAGALARGKEEGKLGCLQQCQGAATSSFSVTVSRFASLEHFNRSRVGFRQLCTPQAAERNHSTCGILTAVASSKWKGPKMSITLDTRLTISLLGRWMD